MRKILFFAIMLLVSVSTHSQNIVKEFVGNVSINREQLFSKTKMFITDKWNNPKRSIQNEDKELGVIQIKTEKNIEIKVGMGLSCSYTYEYMTKIRMKDGKYKIEIYDVNCISSEQIGLGKNYDIPSIPYFEGTEPPVKTKSSGRGISKEKSVSMMTLLRSEFDDIISGYSKYLKIDDDF